MCGIAGIISNSPVTDNLLAILSNLEYRGYDSAGIVVADSGKLAISKDVGYVANLDVTRLPQGTIGIGHCRWATHGGVSKENAHPFTDCKNKVAIVHNGIIDNYRELRDRLSGHTFRSETDSEVVAHLIEDNMDYGFEEAFRLSIGYLEGSYAIVAMHADCRYLMMACKDSPLLVTYNGYGAFVASDSVALPTGDIVKVQDDAIERLEMDTNAVSHHLGAMKLRTVSKNGYPHYMLKEINEQPSTILATLQQDRKRVTSVALDILRARDLILTACGTSRFATIIGRYLLARFAKKMGEHIVGSELHYFSDSFSNSTLILAVSQSGETADVLKGVRQARQKGSRIVSIINRQHSSLESISDIVLYTYCGEEVAVASTKVFTSELIIFYLLSFVMADCYDAGEAELRELPDKVRECLGNQETVRCIAGKIKDAEHIYYIGKGINFAVAGECALKLKEISYIHTESMSAGELKHGTLSLIENETPVIGICPNDNTYQETLSNLHEAKARGGLIIGVSDKNDEVFDHWIPIPVMRDIYYPVACVVIGQLLAYYTTIAKGLNPDRPRSLAKSVTVL